jgi:hypothetical protein
MTTNVPFFAVDTVGKQPDFQLVIFKHDYTPLHNPESHHVRKDCANGTAYQERSTIELLVHNGIPPCHPFCLR